LSPSFFHLKHSDSKTIQSLKDRDECANGTKHDARPYIFHFLLSGARIRFESGNRMKHVVTDYHLPYGSVMEIGQVSTLHAALHNPSVGAQAPWRV
jgi:hypothetical protein